LYESKARSLNGIWCRDGSMNLNRAISDEVVNSFLGGFINGCLGGCLFLFPFTLKNWGLGLLWLLFIEVMEPRDFLT
jgi:hypothetical protein